MASIHNLPKVVTGQSLETMTYTLSGKDITGALITFNVKKQGKLYLQKTVGNGITIVNGPGGVFTINTFKVYLRHGAYRYTLYIALGGVEKRYDYGIWIIKSADE
jgi:hypothetical protein